MYLFLRPHQTKALPTDGVYVFEVADGDWAALAGLLESVSDGNVWTESEMKASEQRAVEVPHVVVPFPTDEDDALIDFPSEG